MRDACWGLIYGQHSFSEGVDLSCLESTNSAPKIGNCAIVQEHFTKGQESAATHEVIWRKASFRARRFIDLMRLASIRCKMIRRARLARQDFD